MDASNGDFNDGDSSDDPGPEETLAERMKALCESLNTDIEHVLWNTDVDLGPPSNYKGEVGVCYILH